MGKAVAEEFEKCERLPQLAQKQHKIAKLQHIEGAQMGSPQPERAEKIEFAKSVQALSQQVVVLTAEVAQLKSQYEP